MLKVALNTLARLHSRPGQLKRPGSPDIYSPCRFTPSNYFRYLGGPEHTVIRGREFIIPKDTMLGQFAQTIEFEEAPASGTFKLSYNGNDTTALAFNASASAIQTALRLVTGLSQVLVTGSIASGLTVVFPGFSTIPLILVPSDYATLLDASSDAVTITSTQSYQSWTQFIKRGDKVIHPDFGLLSVDEVVEMPDLGGATMAFRIRCE